MLDRFNMSDNKLVITPLAAHFKQSSKTYPTSTVKIEKMSHVSYFSAVGSLMYAMVYTNKYCNRESLRTQPW